MTNRYVAKLENVISALLATPPKKKDGKKRRSRKPKRQS